MNTKKLKNIRAGNLTLHCISAEIFQSSESGIYLKGHGTVKINKVGTIYLEFICTEAKNIPRQLKKPLPNDPLEKEETLHLKFETINGEIYTSNDFSLDLSLNSYRPPTHYFIFLSSITSLSSKETEPTLNENHIYFEFCEQFKIPKNKVNSTISTLGSESHSLNEVNINADNYSIKMVEHSGYTTVSATGNFDSNKLFTCLVFYIGFSSSSMLQPYYKYERNGRNITKTILSTSNAQRRQVSCSPMIPIGKDNKDLNCHHQLLHETINLYNNKPHYFNSIYSQWVRVWHSFQSKSSIMQLTLSVAIEGLLNDIFIPIIKSKCNNHKLDMEIEEIKKLIKALNLNDDQKARIIGSVSYWKVITPSKALDHLIDKEIITKEEKKLWSKLRNDSAHPKIKIDSIAQEKIEYESITICLNLFHRLILNTLSFSGSIYILKTEESPKRVTINHKDIV